MKRNRIRTFLGWCPKETTLKPQSPQLFNATRLLALVTLVSITASGIYSARYISLAGLGASIAPTKTSLEDVNPSLIQCRNGSFLLAYTSKTSEIEYEILISSSEDGLKWNRPTSIITESLRSNIVVPDVSVIQCADDSYMIAYTSYFIDTEWTASSYHQIVEGGIYVASSMDAVQWGAPRRVDSPANSVSLIQCSDGSYMIAFYEISASERICLTKSDDGVYWERRLLLEGEDASSVFSSPCLVQTRHGPYVLAFMNASFGGLSSSEVEFTHVTVMKSGEDYSWVEVDVAIPRSIFKHSAPRTASDLSLIETRDGSLMMVFAANLPLQPEILGKLSGVDGTWSEQVKIVGGSNPSLIQLSNGSYMIALLGVQVSRSSDGYSWGTPISVSQAASGAAVVESSVYMTSGALWCSSAVCVGLSVMRRRRGSDRKATAL